ncbi:MAG: carbon-nitrogen hydrolase family protein [Candidatus Aminicenantes bacterium]|nr:carbon-nitrogen hydrolase family protein [Candidatus Aminicenantes bacterium]
MSRLLKIALIQQHATPDKEDNLKRGLEAFEKAAGQGAHVIAFAELAFTSFYPQQPAAGDVLRYAEPIPNPTTQQFSELSKKYETVTILNLFEKRGDQAFDSSPVIDADGSLLGVTRMVHIIEAPCFHETGYYAPGPGNELVFATRYGRIGIAICYDRHFPEYMRALGLQGAELVIVPQAGSVGEWPAGLFEAEMQVAGFRNGYFTALCNRVGQEECITFEGKSFVTAPDGRVIAQAPAEEDAILFAEIDLDEVNASHARRHFLPDRRPELYPGWLQKK